MSGARERVLGAIRRALAATTPAAPADPTEVAHALRRPPRDLVEVFVERAAKVGAEVVRHPGPELASDLLESLLAELRTARALPPETPLVVAAPPHADPSDPFDIDVTIVDATLGIASLGAVLLEGPRLAPMTAEVVIVRLSAQDLVMTLSEALSLHRPGDHRLIMAGPSKTADIEGVLVTGVHGPRRLVIALVDPTPGT